MSVQADRRGTGEMELSRLELRVVERVLHAYIPQQPHDVQARDLLVRVRECVSAEPSVVERDPRGWPKLSSADDQISPG